MRAVIVCMLLGCGISAPQTEMAEPVTAPEPEAAPQTCDDKISALEQRMATFLNGIRLPVPAGVNVPEGRGSPIVGERPEIALLADGTLIAQGGPIAPGRLQASLDNHRRNWSILHPPSKPYPAEFHAWVDAGLQVEEVTRALSSDHAWLLFVTDPSVASNMPPCPESLTSTCALMRSDEPARRAVAVAEAMSETIGRCASMTILFDAFANVVANNKVRFYQDEVPTALRECDCNVDMEQFTFLSSALFGVDPLVRTMEVHAADSATQTIGEYVAAHSPR